MNYLKSPIVTMIITIIFTLLTGIAYDIGYMGLTAALGICAALTGSASMIICLDDIE